MDATKVFLHSLECINKQGDLSDNANNIGLNHIQYIRLIFLEMIAKIELR